MLPFQSFCLPFVRGSKPFLLPEHSRPVQVVVDPQKRSRTFDSTVMAAVHNVSTIHEIKVGGLVGPRLVENVDLKTSSLIPQF